jgi:hypothetical protein
MLPDAIALESATVSDYQFSPYEWIAFGGGDRHF